MQGQFNMSLAFFKQNSNLSLDELVIALMDLFEKKAFVQILEFILSLFIEIMITKIKNNEKISVTCCDGATFKLHDRRSRNIKSSLGEIQINDWRVKCSKCGKKKPLLGNLLNLRTHHRKTNELERLVVEAVSNNTYRRAVKQLEINRVIKLPHTTAHYWTMQSDCDEIKIPETFDENQPFKIFADGTKFKGEGENGKARKGDLKIAIAIKNDGKMIPLTCDSGQNWQEIAKNWQKDGVSFPQGSILIADGEEAISQNLSPFVESHQRCHWHLDRDLHYTLWLDGIKAKDSNPLRKSLRGILAIDLPATDFQEVSEAEKDKIEEEMELAEEKITKFVNYLRGKGYKKAANYLDRAKYAMFNYVKRWLKWGVLCPRASSMIERVMREIARRLKKIAYGWSNRGAEKISRIILRKFTDAEGWEKDWAEKMKINESIKFHLGNFTVVSPTFVH